MRHQIGQTALFSGKLTEQESKKLNAMIEQIDELNLLKARAAFTLRNQDYAS